MDDKELWVDTDDRLGENIEAFRRQIDTAGIDVGIAGVIAAYADDAAVAYGEGDYEAARKALADGRHELQRVTPRLAIPASVTSRPRSIETSRQRPIVSEPTDIRFAPPAQLLPSKRRYIWGIVIIVAMFAATFLVLAATHDSTTNGPSVGAGQSGALPDDGVHPIYLGPQQVLKMAGLPSTYQFISTDPADQLPLAQLKPGQVGWTSPDNTADKGQATVILTSSPLDGGYPDDGGYGPSGMDELLIANTGHGLVAIYFPSSCEEGMSLGSGPPSGPYRNIIKLKTVTGLCS